MDIKQRDGGRQEIGVWCYADGGLVLLWRWAALAQESDEREGKSSNTAETGEETFTQTALHARLVLLTAHQESRMNDHFTPKSS